MVPTSLQKRPWPFTPPPCTGWRVGASHQSRSPHCLTNMTPSCSSWRWRGSKKHTGKQAENIAFNFSDAYFLTSGSRIARVFCLLLICFHVHSKSFQREVSSEPESEGGARAHRAGLRQPSRGSFQDQASPANTESLQRGQGEDVWILSKSFI